MMYWTRGEGFATDCSSKPQDTLVIGGGGADNNKLPKIISRKI